MSLQDDRNRLVQLYWDSFKRTSWPTFDTLTDEQVGREYRKQDRLLDEYGELLPFVPVSRCPFSDAVLKYVFDPFGMDGPWWAKGNLAEYPDADGGDHFRVLLGAVDFHGRTPREAEPHSLVLPGPGAPFVVPRLLELPEMIGVVSQFDLPHGDTAYLTAYFSQEPIHGAFLHQPWAREAYQVRDTNGEYESWSIANDPWDFDLQPWIDDGKLRWIEPGDADLQLKEEGDCPFVGLSGEQAPRAFHHGKLESLPLPGGENFDPTD